tara:strand:- start:22911 stop:23090 length:180 start_codon:yes stop_codon:yes gene_type:complete
MMNLGVTLELPQFFDFAKRVLISFKTLKKNRKTLMYNSDLVKWVKSFKNQNINLFNTLD